MLKSVRQEETNSSIAWEVDFRKFFHIYSRHQVDFREVQDTVFQGFWPYHRLIQGVMAGFFGILSSAAMQWYRDISASRRQFCFHYHVHGPLFLVPLDTSSLFLSEDVFHGTKTTWLSSQ
jgi:hypothetical protein